jgi:hypothetical protein
MLQLNSSKTTILQFHKQKTLPQTSPLLTLSNKTIKTDTCTKFLGLHITDTLNWSVHCDKLVSKISSSPFMFVVLRRTIHNLSTLKSVYFSLVQSHLQYGIVFWGDSSAAKDVFVAQKKVIRAMLGRRYKRSNIALAPCRDFFISLGILTLPSLFIFECCKFYRRHPNYFQSIVETHDHNTRRKADATLKDVPSLSPHYHIASVYNKLPRQIKQEPRLGAFSQALKSMLLGKCYYRVEEYFAEIWQS